jgi:hypothetical protein
MLIDKISKLEDIIEINNKLTNQLVSLSSFRYFTVMFYGKNYDFIEKSIILEFIKYIDTCIPIISSWSMFGINEKECYITVETKSNCLYNTFTKMFNSYSEKKQIYKFNIWKESDASPYDNLFAVKNKDNEWEII